MMSVNIHWRQIDDNGTSFNYGTSSDLEILKEVFRDVIGRCDIDKLRAMEVATKNKFYGEIADIVEQVGDIKIWGVC